jgi:hypothetical protein
MESSQRKGEVIARIVQVIDGKERTLNLTLDHALDIEFFRTKLAEKTPIEIQYFGTPSSRRLLVWYKGRRVDQHTDIIGGPNADAAATAPVAITFKGLGKVYARAMQEAIVVRDTLPSSERAGFDMNHCASTLARLYTAARIPQVGEDVANTE